MKALEGAFISKRLSHKMKKILILLNTLLLSYYCWSQTSLTSTQFLQQQIALFPTQETNPSFKAPFLDEIELRTETEEFDLEQQELVLRFSPISQEVRQAQKAYFDAKVYRNTLSFQEWEMEQLEQAYEWWIDQYFIHLEIEKSEQLLVVFKDKKKVLQKQRYASNFKLADLIEIESDINDLVLKLEQLQNEKTQTTPLPLPDISDRQLLWDDLVTPEQIAILIPNTASSSVINTHLLNQEFQARQQEMETEYQLEIAEKNQVLDFVQIRQAGDDDDFWRERISLSMGIQFPLKGNQKLDLEELKVEQGQNAAEHQLELQQLKLKIAAKGQEIKNSLSAWYRFLEVKQREQENAQILVNNFSQQEGISPLMLLEVKELEYKNELKAIDLQEDIYENFVEWLVMTGYLGRKPRVNYLSEEMVNF